MIVFISLLLYFTSALAEFYFDELKNTQFAYSNSHTNQTQMYLPESILFTDELCVNVESPEEFSGVFCSNTDRPQFFIDEYRKITLSIAIPPGTLLVIEMKGKAVMRTKITDDIYKMNLLSMQALDFAFRTKYMVKNVELYKAFVNGVLMPEAIIPPIDSRFDIDFPVGYGAIDFDKNLRLDFRSDILSSQKARDFALDAIGYANTVMGMNMLTLKSGGGQDIEPGSMFFAVTPRFRVSLNAIDTNGDGTFVDRALLLEEPPVRSVEKPGDFKVIKTYSQATDIQMLNVEEEGNVASFADTLGRVQKEITVIRGYSNYGYVEYLLPVSDIVKHRCIVSPNEKTHKSINELTTQSMDNGGSTSASTSTSIPAPKTRICIWGSGKMDGQKQIWLQQTELLDKNKFDFTWFYVKATENDYTVHPESQVPDDVWYDQESPVYQRLSRLPHVVVLPAIHTTIKFEELSEDPLDGTKRLNETWNQDIDEVFKYITSRLELFKYEVERVTPTWVRKVYTNMIAQIQPARCDVIVYGNNRGYSSDVMLRKTAFMLNIPVVTELLNLFVHPDIVPDALIAPSTYSLHHESIRDLKVRRKIGFTYMKVPPHTIVIPPGVTTANIRSNPHRVYYKLNPQNTISVGKSSNAIKNRIKIGFMARLSNEKNPGLFVLSAKKLIEKWLRASRDDLRFMGVGIEFVMIGSGAISTHLQELVTLLGISEYFHFTGWLSGDALQSAVEGVDIMVNPSLRAWSETFCIANIESMALGIPLVTFGVGGVGEYVEFDEDLLSPLSKTDKPTCRSLRHTVLNTNYTVANNLILVNNAHPESLADAVWYLIDRPDEMMRVGKAGASTVLRYFSTDIQMARYAAFYSRVKSLPREHVCDVNPSLSICKK